VARGAGGTGVLPTSQLSTVVAIIYLKWLEATLSIGISIQLVAYAHIYLPI